MSAKTLENVREKHPVGQRVVYWNPGKPGHQNVGTVSDYLVRSETLQNEWIVNECRVAYIELAFGTRLHTVTVNQLGKYYRILP